MCLSRVTGKKGPTERERGRWLPHREELTAILLSQFLNLTLREPSVSEKNSTAKLRSPRRPTPELLAVTDDDEPRMFCANDLDGDFERSVGHTQNQPP